VEAGGRQGVALSPASFHSQQREQRRRWGEWKQRCLPAGSILSC